MFIPSTFKRPVSSWKALNLRKTLLMASSTRLKPLNCSRLPCVYAQETLTFLLTQKQSCVKKIGGASCRERRLVRELHGELRNLAQSLAVDFMRQFPGGAAGWRESRPMRR